MVKTLNPGVASRGYVVFDVPPNGEYTVQLSGGFGSGERALVTIMDALRGEQSNLTPVTQAPPPAYQPYAQQQPTPETLPSPQQLTYQPRAVPPDATQ